MAQYKYEDDLVSLSGPPKDFFRENPGGKQYEGGGSPDDMIRRLLMQMLDPKNMGRQKWGGPGMSGYGPKDQMTPQMMDAMKMLTSLDAGKSREDLASRKLDIEESLGGRGLDVQLQGINAEQAYRSATTHQGKLNALVMQYNSDSETLQALIKDGTQPEAIKAMGDKITSLSAAIQRMTAKVKTEKAEENIDSTPTVDPNKGIDIRFQADIEAEKAAVAKAEAEAAAAAETAPVEEPTTVAPRPEVSGQPAIDDGPTMTGYIGDLLSGLGGFAAEKATFTDTRKNWKIVNKAFGEKIKQMLSGEIPQEELDVIAQEWMQSAGIEGKWVDLPEENKVAYMRKVMEFAKNSQV